MAEFFFYTTDFELEGFSVISIEKMTSENQFVTSKNKRKGKVNGIIKAKDFKRRHNSGS